MCTLSKNKNKKTGTAILISDKVDALVQVAIIKIP